MTATPDSLTLSMTAVPCRNEPRSLLSHSQVIACMTWVFSSDLGLVNQRTLGFTAITDQLLKLKPLHGPTEDSCEGALQI